MIFLILDTVEKTPTEKRPTGYVLIKEYPNSKKIGYFEPFSSGELSKHPEYWKPVYENEVFKTEDKNYVFGDSNMFAVDKKTFEIRNCQLSMINTVFSKESYVFFSDIKEVQKYIDFRKPIISLSDLENLKCINDSRYMSRIWRYVLHEVVNELYKLKFLK